MLTPELLLAHADRLLAASTDEADLRRSISATYYALFNRLTSDAAESLAGAGSATARSAVRRSFDHRAVRKVCEGVSSAGRARPRVLDDFLPANLPADLIEVASAFVELRSVRLEADYDLDAVFLSPTAKGCQALAHDAFAKWAVIRPSPAGQAFLLAIAFAERGTRRG